MVTETIIHPRSGFACVFVPAVLVFNTHARIRHAHAYLDVCSGSVNPGGGSGERLRCLGSIPAQLLLVAGEAPG